MNSEELISAIGDFFLQLGMFLLMLWNYICLFFQFIGRLIAQAFHNAFPVLPPVSRFLGIKKLSLTLMIIILFYIISINIYAYSLYTKDKSSAKKKKERISEFRLLKVALLGGGFGSFLGMKINRHKTLKKKFIITVNACLILQTLLYSSIIGFFGFWIYLS